MSDQDIVTYEDVKAAIDAARVASAEAGEAADAVLARSDLWLTLHPIQHMRMRRRLLDTRAELYRRRDAMISASAAFQRQHRFQESSNT